jgi:hypothetical protein
MRKVQIEFFEIGEHPNPQAVYEWIKNNWHDLGQHNVNELINSLQKLKEKIGGTLTYSIGQNPDQSEHITFEGFDKEILDELDEKECPLTGHVWDEDVILALREDNMQKLLNTIHQDTEYYYSNAGLKELCEANEYEFDINGVYIGNYNIPNLD